MIIEMGISDNNIKTTAFPLVSLIIPVFNVRPFLTECLESVTKQDYSRLEIIVIDDGSDDGSGSLCDVYAEKDKRMKVFHQENKGLSAARNSGLSKANGEIIAFLDSDDAMMPSMISTMTEKMLKHDADIVSCGFLYYQTEKKMKETAPYQEVKYEEEILNSDQALKALTDSRIKNAVWNKLYRRELFDGICFPDGHVYEDVIITFRLLAKAKRILTIPEQFIRHRKHTGSITGTPSVGYIRDYIQNESILEGFIKENIPSVFSKADYYRVRNKTLHMLIVKWVHLSGPDRKQTSDIRKEIIMRCLDDHIDPLYIKTGIRFVFSFCPWAAGPLLKLISFIKHHK